MPPRKQPGTFWERTAYRAANDNTTVAIYRFVMSIMGVIIVGLLTHYGSNLAATQEAQGKTLQEHATAIELLRQDHTRDQAAIQERVKMIEDRDVRMLDRLNINTNNITALQTVQSELRRR